MSQPSSSSVSGSQQEDCQVYCRLCLLVVDSRAAYWQRHRQKHGHKGHIKALGLSGDPGPVHGQTYCNTCFILISIQDWTGHLESEDHLLCLKAAVLREAKDLEARKPKSRVDKKVKPISKVRFSNDSHTKSKSEASASTNGKYKKRKRKAIEEDSASEVETQVIVKQEQPKPISLLRRSGRTPTKTEKADDSSSEPPQIKGGAGVAPSIKDEGLGGPAEILLKIAEHIPRIADLSPDLDRILQSSRTQLRKQGGKRISLCVTDLDSA